MVAWKLDQIPMLTFWHILSKILHNIEHKFRLSCSSDRQLYTDKDSSESQS